MNTILLTLAFLKAVSGDVCHDFCISKLTPQECSKGSYCKGQVCHALFWRAVDDICVHGSSPRDCPDTLSSVRCDEAERSLPDRPGYIGDARPHATGRIAAVDCHHHMYEQCDVRPWVHARFRAHDSDRLFSLLFDTGSSKSFIRYQAEGSSGEPEPENHGEPVSELVDRGFMGCVPAGRDEGLSHVVAHLSEKLEEGEELLFGTDTLQVSVPVNCQVNDVVELVDYGRPREPFHYHAKFLLTSNRLSRFSAAGMISAAPNSDFAKSTGTFAFVASSRDRFATGSTGELIMGVRKPTELIHFCEDDLGLSPSVSAWNPFVRVPRIRELDDHWAIRGELHVRIPLSADPWFPIHPVEWIVDTGAGHDRGHYVTDDVYAELVAGIGMTGAEVDDYFYRWQTTIRKCTAERIARFPLLEISVGRSPDTQLTIAFGPDQYLERSSKHPNMCYLKVDRAGVNASPLVRLLGMGFLGQTVTVFDNKNDSVSFCKI